MSKENTLKLIEVIESNTENIIELSKDLYRNTMDGSCSEGWRVGIIADIDGNIYDYCWSQGTSNVAIYEGEATRVIDYTVYNEVGELYINKEDLTEEEYNNFVEWSIAEEYIETPEDAENELTYRRISDFDSDYRTNIIDRITAETIEYDVDNYYREKAEEQIDITLESLQRDLEFEESII